jgi:hypothetical protein
VEVKSINSLSKEALDLTSRIETGKKSVWTYSPLFFQPGFMKLKARIVVENDINHTILEFLFHSLKVPKNALRRSYDPYLHIINRI